ncbi:TolC family protein [Salinimicrobium sp. MT39]|jgi:outer membrane protein TolC|uniref:TolC family protein n=2 Tax=Flavobacteriaceae TaxID=49546 RepID=A0A9X3CX23_9FLAO|nr:MULTISPECIES: TolC family protein [Flavobacteriaceae]MCX2838347.1 TolC family protein [Salinimicrobium profundisediminis]MDT0686379.1 TolC family protein [Zunongwangia sp. F225]
MRKKIINTGVLIMLFVGISTTASYAQEEEFESRYLNKYLVLAAEENPELRSLFNEYLAVLEEVTQEGTLPDPQASFGYFIQPVETRVGAQQAMASFSQMFPWFGTLGAQERVAAERAQARLQVFEDAKLELYRDIKITYTELYYLETAIEVMEENLELLSSFKAIAEVQFESGSTGFSSVLQVELEEEELESRLAYLRDSRLPLVTEFEELLNSELQEPLEFPDNLWEEELIIEKRALLEMILARNPRLEQLDHEARSFGEQLTVAKKMGLPSFTLGASYTNIAPRTDLEPGMALPDNGQDVFIFPQVGIRIPLYRKKYKSMRQEAILQQEAVELRRENLENELETELERLYRDYIDARRNVELYGRLTTIARQSLELFQTELSTGRNNVLEIIRMERQLLNYGLELARARTEQNNNVYRINYLIGENYE